MVTGCALRLPHRPDHRPRGAATGLDFPADIGTPILAAVGGAVQSVEWHAQNGQLIEIDHGNGLVTRQAHVCPVRWCSPATSSVVPR